VDPTPEIFEPPAPGVPPQTPARWGGVLPIERAAAALEVILCSGFPTQLMVVTVLTTFGMKARLADGGLSPHFVFALTLIDTVLLVGLVLFFLRAHRESPREVLFGWRPPTREALVGIALVPVSLAIVVLVLLVVQLAMPSLRNVPHNPLQDMVHTRSDAVLFALVAMIAGGVREEIQRAFVLRRFEQYLGGSAAGLVIFSVLFGLGHLEQGYDVAIATATLGAFWGILYLRRRSVISPMVGHAGFNLAQVVKFVVLGA
jgi:membrane protease YdiL (CAAX protease family)